MKDDQIFIQLHIKKLYKYSLIETRINQLGRKKSQVKKKIADTSKLLQTSYNSVCFDGNFFKIALYKL